MRRVCGAPCPQGIVKELDKARNRARLVLGSHGEQENCVIDDIAYTEHQVIGAWFPHGLPSES
jgi:hypothetical protein